MAAHPLTRMALASLAWWAVMSSVGDAAMVLAFALGAIAPLAVSAATWVLVERTHGRTPERVSGLLVKLFGAKLVLFGTYVAVILMLLPNGHLAFVASFTSQYILLHLMEAWYLRRLCSGGTPALGR
jgi:hypothetical protein